MIAACFEIHPITILGHSESSTHQNERCSSHSKIRFKTEDAQQLDNSKEELRALALEQHKLLMAA